MYQRSFIIFAGCNGSGKSTYSSIYSNFITEDVDVFDYDKTYLGHYNDMEDSELREQIAMNKTTEEFENYIDESFLALTSIAFETNFNNVPINWIQKAISLNYRVVIFFFVLDSIEKAKERVLIRAKNNGHFVNDETIRFKWKEGYKNINTYYELANKVIFINNSKDNEIPEIVFEINKKDAANFEIILTKEPPLYLQHRLPNIFDLIKEEKT